MGHCSERGKVGSPKRVKQVPLPQLFPIDKHSDFLQFFFMWNN